MGLTIVFHLQPVFHVTKKSVRISKGTGIFPLEPFVLNQLVQARDCLRTLQKWLAASVEQLRHLSYEFNFSDPSASEFDVPFEFPFLDHFILDAPLHRGDLLQYILVDRAWVTKRLYHLQEIGAQ